MSRPNKLHLDLALLRLLTVGGIGALAGLLVTFGLSNAELTAPTWVPWLCGIVAAAISWRLTRPSTDFAEDCLDVPPGREGTFQVAPQRLASSDTSPTLADATGNNTVELAKTKNEDDSLTVTVTVNGLTKREFNTLRGRLEQVKGVKWTHPKNLGNSKREMVGTIPAGASQKPVVHKLEELTGKRV